MSNNLFTFFEGTTEEIKETTEELYKEIKWDFENNKPIIQNGNFVFVTGLEAIKTWIWKTLQISRYKYMIYSWDYGHELESFIGHNYTQALTNAEITRELTECLTINPYILGLENINITFKDGLITINFKVNTTYGTDGIEVNM